MKVVFVFYVLSLVAVLAIFFADTSYAELEKLILDSLMTEIEKNREQIFDWVLPFIIFSTEYV